MKFINVFTILALSIVASARKSTFKGRRAQVAVDGANSAGKKGYGYGYGGKKGYGYAGK
eukprot:CAMPEP_0194210536 /NCGR_PEP_ID=MMETSP0156-20130528/8692_1 /TAXON_ID=33649 /ORGANISM="Thalassionema nitzschioides, Strain L26-B" /LENGTH=58 /DNA_ID=CAMNT_0038937897 /DNA_START=33 /DNA_END=206 /DNA_ORIENTATION=-